MFTDLGSDYDRTSHDAVSYKRGSDNGAVTEHQGPDGPDANSTILPDDVLDHPEWTRSFRHLKLPNLIGKYHDDLLEFVPHEAFVWAKDDAELKQVKRISAFIIEDTRSGDPGKKSILGFRVEYQRRWWEPMRYVGRPRVTDAEDHVQNWHEENMHHFDIDGLDGERVTEVGVGLGDSLSLSVSVSF